MTEEEKKLREDSFEITIGILRKLELPSHLKGYEYIKEAVFMLLINKDWKTSVSKTLYPELARVFKTTTYSVERNIRTVVKKRNRREVERIFSYTADRMSNGAFLSLLTEEVELRIRREQRKQQEAAAE